MIWNHLEGAGFYIIWAHNIVKEKQASWKGRKNRIVIFSDPEILYWYPCVWFQDMWDIVNKGTADKMTPNLYSKHDGDWRWL